MTLMRPPALPAPTEREQVRSYSPALISGGLYRREVIGCFPRSVRQAMRDWSDAMSVALSESNAAGVHLDGLWIARQWLDEAVLERWCSPLGAKLFLELYWRGFFGDSPDAKGPSPFLLAYANLNCTWAQHLELISRIDEVYEADYRALIREPGRVRLQRISWQMLEDIFAENAMPQGDSQLQVGGIVVQRHTRRCDVGRKSRFTHTYSWSDGEGVVYERKAIYWP
ncbi:hypothetical protein PSEUDO9AZ_40192 [Pseudomonas sp. 9AZ]|nr:hypothetical protein PSEUDO9AZ_40192 [Pseudomonas sp. 9AZ]